VAYLRLRELVKSYDGRSNAVDHVSIDVARGEFVTFLGPSGSGKTTTLLMIAGFETPTGGGVELGGRDLALSKPYERNIGMVFQNYALFPHMTAAKNVVFPLKMRHFPRKDMEARVERMLELVGLGRFADRYPRELSGGQQQRVALARGLVFNPDVLLLDEPLGALDKNLRQQMQVEIKRIHREIGITMIYVTHDQSEAMTLSDRLAVFRDGRIEQVGAPLEVYNRPLSRFVGEFIGDSNFFAGRMDPARPHWVELNGIGPVRVSDAASLRGGEVELMIRPERLRLRRSGETGPEENAFDVTVDEVIHHGDYVLVIGKTHGLPLRARILGSEHGLPLRGSMVQFTWAPADAHVLAHRSAQ
jgi:putative spermidine/putrescine transport system ATP-binding protein